MDTAWLKARGIDAKSIHDYAARGWIERVVRGVYRRPLPKGAQADELSWQVVLLSLQRLKGCSVHLGGESALDFAGHVHYLSLGGTPRVHFYGDAPTWLKRLPTTEPIILHRSRLFATDPVGVDDTDGLDEDNGWAVDVWRWPIRASCPERAILEAIDELPNNASFEHLDPDIRRSDRAAAQAAHDAPGRLPQHQGPAAVFRLCGSARTRLAEIPGNRADRPWQRAAGACPWAEGSIRPTASPFPSFSFRQDR